MAEVDTEITNSKKLDIVSAEGQPSNAEKPKKPPPNTELNARKQQQQLQEDKTKLLEVEEEVASLTQTSGKKPAESKSENKELSVTEQMQIEEKKFRDRLYGNGSEKQMEIELNALKKAKEERRATGKFVDLDDYCLRAFKEINTQLDKYAPGRFSGKLDPNLDYKDYHIPSYMIRVDDKVTYDPFYEPPFGYRFLYRRSVDAGWGWLNKLGNIHEGEIDKPKKVVVQELRDTYIKKKTAEAAAQKKPN